jgi:hypothetical protein
MATKASGIPCYDNAADDEPLFVIRASDPAAPGAIRFWAHEARVHVPGEYDILGHRAALQ